MNKDFISFIIITFNRYSDCCECIKSINNLSIKFNYEIIVIDNSLEVSHKQIASIKNEKNVVYYHLGENLGVSGGRNAGIKLSKGNYLFFVDDDAILDINFDITSLITTFKNKSNIGVIAFQSLDYYSKRINFKEFPHRNKHKIAFDKFYTYHYVGVGHVFQKEMIEKIGLYETDFFYGMEEFDLSYRIIDQGYKIFYDSSFIVLHKKNQKGRISNKHLIYNYTINKIKVSYLNLPKRYFLSHIFFWSLYFIFKSRFDFISLIKLYRTVIQYHKENIYRRKPINKTTIYYLKKIGANLYY